MKALNLTLFDDTLSGTTSTWYSPSEYYDEVGKHDQIGVTASVAEVSGTLPTLTVTIEGSADGQHWSQVEAAPQISTGISANSVYFGYQNGVNAVLPALVRLGATLGGTGPRCRLKLSVTCRDY